MVIFIRKIDRYVRFYKGWFVIIISKHGRAGIINERS